MKHFKEQTEVYITYDDKAIYFAFRCLQKEKLVRRTIGIKHDMPVYRDDSVDVVLVPIAGGYGYYRFVGNFMGQKMDEKSWGDKNWNGKWSYAASRIPGGWTAEFNIPWKTIGMTQADLLKTIGINVFRNIVRPEGHGWNSTTMVWNLTDQLVFNQGKLNMLPEIPVSQVFVTTDDHFVYCDVEVYNNSPKEWKLKGDFEVKRKDSRQIVKRTPFSVNLAPKEKKRFVDKRRVLSGTYEVDISLYCVDAKGRDVAILEQTSIAEVPQSLDVELRKYFFHDKVQPIVYLKDGVDAESGVVKFTIQQNEKVLNTTTVSADKFPAKSNDPRWNSSKGKLVSSLMDVSKLEPGFYDIEVTLETKGCKKRVGWLCFEKPAKPVWLDNKIGMDNKVPQPWTAVQVDGKTFKVWGREYKFVDSAVLGQIVNQGQDMLASKITLAAVIDGKKVTWKPQKFEILSASDTEIVFKVVNECQEADWESIISLGYDGLLKYDIRLSSKMAVKLDRLSIDIPMKREAATLFSGTPDDNVRGKNKPWPNWSGTPHGLIPNRKVSGPFIPYFWIGNDDQGLSWYCEGMKNWVTKTPKDAIEILPGSDDVLCRINIVDSPISLKGPLELTFGLQATPVKQATPRKIIGRTYHWPNVAFPVILKGEEVGRIMYPAEGNIDPQKGTLSLWIDRDTASADELLKRYGQKENSPVKPVGFNVTQNTGEINLMALVFPSDEKIVVRMDSDNDEFSVWQINADSSKKIMAGKYQEWGKKQNHTVSFSWGDEWAIYIDGHKICSADKKELANDSLANTRLYIGGNFMVQRIKSQDISCRKNQLPQITADSSTLLLDDFTRWNPDVSIPISLPEKISGPNKVRGGSLMGMWDILPCAGGNAIRLAGLGTSVDICAYWKRIKHWDAIYFHESWTEFEGIPYTIMHEEKLKDFVSRAHKANMEVILYTGSAASGLSKEVFDYLDEFAIEPLRIIYYRTASEPQLCYHQSMTGQWQNMMLYKFKELIKKYDIDGLYFDGSFAPAEDKNRWHGAGYIDRDGKLMPTTQIFEYRRWAQRIRSMVDSLKPGFHLDIHQCFMLPATMAYGDSQWTGEQYLMIADAFYGGVLQKCLAMDAFRATSMGKQFGIHADFLTEPKKQQWRLDNAQSFAWLHGGPVREWQDDNVTRAMKEVGLDINSSNWRPYFKNSSGVKLSSPNVKLSYFKGRDGRWLIILLNTGEKEDSVDVEFDSSILDMPIGQSMWNVEEDKFFDKFNRKFKIGLKPWKPVVLLTE